LALFLHSQNSLGVGFTRALYISEPLFLFLKNKEDTSTHPMPGARSGTMSAKNNARNNLLDKNPGSSG
jgi:hypothetical protein